MPKNGKTIDKMLINDGSDLEDYVGPVSTSSSVHNHKGTATGKSRALVCKTKPKSSVSESSGDEQAPPQNDVEPSCSSDSEEEPAKKKAKQFRKPKAPVVLKKEPVLSKKGTKPLRRPKGPEESDDEPEIVLNNRGPKYMDPKEIDAIIRKHQSQLTSGERTPPVGHTPPPLKGAIHATPPLAKATEKKVSLSSSDEDDSEDSDVPDGKAGAVDIAKRQESNNGAATKRKRADGNKENAEGEGSSDEEQGVAKESVADKKVVALECAESAQSVLGEKACAVDKDDGQDSSSDDELDVPAKAGALLFD